MTEDTIKAARARLEAARSAPFTVRRRTSDVEVVSVTYADDDEKAGKRDD